MSTTIDNKVVEMSFDNSKFESGVKTSISTLDRLKEALNFDRSTESFKGLQNAANGIDVSGATNSFSQLASKILSLTPAITIVQDLTRAAEGLVKTLASNTIGKIISGGFSRSSNLQDAKFMLEGLDVEWENILKDIEYGVNDTAYGLDAAAKAASSLVASGVEIGTDMRQSLRGISGVAAMTNSSYEEISSIFTTVAGQGKLMTMQLRQLESRGMNAAATLANHLGTSEAAVREMVSKGEIDFATFSKAMDNAFGEHAKDSNKTLQGVLSNIGSALSRVGQRFIEPIIANEGPLVNMLNAVRLGINEINAGLQPISDTVVPWLTNEKMTGVLDKITIKIRSLTSGWNQLTQVFGNVGITTSELTSRLSVLYEGTEKGTKFESAIKNTDAFKEKIKELGVSADNYTGTSLVKFIEGTDALKQAISDVGVSSGDLKKVLQATSEGLRDQVAAGVENADSLEKQADKIDQLLTNIDKGRVSLDDIVKALDEKSPLQIAMSGVSNIFNTITKILGTMSSAFKKVFGNRGIKSAKEFALSFESITKAIDDLFTTDVLTKLTNSFSGLFSIIDLLCEVILQSLKLAFTVINSIFGITAGSLLDVSSSAGNAVTQFHDLVMEGDYIGRAFESVGKWITFGVDCFKNLIKTIKQLPIVQDIISTFKDTTSSAMSKIVEVMKEVYHVLEDVNNFSFDKLKSAFGKLFDIDKSSEGGSVLSIFKNFSKDVDDSTEESEKSVNKFIDKIVDALSTFKSKIKGVFNVDFNDIFAIGAVVMIMITLNNLAKVLQLIVDVCPSFGASLNKITDSLTGFMKQLKETVKQVGQATSLKILASAFKDLAEGIIILAGAVFILGKMETNDVAKGIITVIGALFALTASLSTLMVIVKYSSIDKKTILTIIGALGALALIATAINYVSAKIEGLTFGKVFAFLASLSALCLIMGVVLKGIDHHFDPKTVLNSSLAFLEASGSILVMAGTLALLSKVEIDKSIIGKLVALAGIAAAEFLVFKILAYYIQNPVNKSQIAAMLAVPLALLEYAVILKAIGKMNFDDVNIGQIVGITIGLTVFFALLSKVSKGCIGLGKDLLMLAVAIGLIEVIIKSFKKIKIDNVPGILAGCFGVFFALAALAFFINNTVGKEMVKTNRSLLEIAAAIGLLVGSIYLLGKINLGQLAKGVGAVSVLLVVMGMVVSASSTVKSAKTTLIGLGVLVAELAAIVLIFKIVGKDNNDVLKASGCVAILVGSLWFLMTGLSNMEKISGKAFVQAVVCEALIGLLAGIIAGYFAIGGKAEGSIKIAGSIAILVATMIISIKLLDKIGADVEKAIAPMIGMLVVTALLGTLLGVLTSQIGDKADAACKIAVSLGALLIMLSITLKILASIGAAASAAWEALGQVAVVIIGILAIAGIIGAIKGAGPAIEAGITVLCFVVDAMATTILDIVKKIAQTAIDMFVALGQGLSDFWNNIQPFLDGIKKVDKSIVTGAENIVALVALLGAAGFIQAVEDFLGIKPNISDLKTTLSGFAEAMVAFANVLGEEFPADMVSKAALAGQTLMSLVNNMPSKKDMTKLQDWVAIQGNDPSMLTNALSGLASSLAAFGTGLGKGFNADMVLMAAQAGQTLMSLATNLPSDKELTRLQQWFSEGAIDFENFGTQLSAFGASMVAYSNAVKTIDKNAIDNSITCGQALAKLAKHLPSYGDGDGKTVKEWFGGKKVNMDDFGIDLENFANHLVKYAEILSNLGEDGQKLISDTTGIAGALSELANGLPSYGGIIQEWFSGKKVTMDVFGSQLESFADSMVYYSGKIQEIKESMQTKTDAIVKAVNTLNEFAPVNKDIKKLTDIGDTLTKFGEKMGKFSKSLDSVSTTKITSLATALNNLINSLKNASSQATVGADSMYIIGVNAAQGFINGVNSKLAAAAKAGNSLGITTKNSLKRALDIHSPSKVFEKLGNFTSEGFINGLSGVVGKASAIFTNLKSVAESRFSGIIGDVKNAISSGISGQTLSITPVLDLSEIQNQAGDIGSIIGDYSNIDIGSSFDLSSITAFGMNGFNPNSKFDSLAETIKGISSGNVTNEFNNTFDVSGYTGSTDELASRISELLQEQVERTGAVWA